MIRVKQAYVPRIQHPAQLLMVCKTQTAFHCCTGLGVEHCMACMLHRALGLEHIPSAVSTETWGQCTMTRYSFPNVLLLNDAIRSSVVANISIGVACAMQHSLQYRLNSCLITHCSVFAMLCFVGLSFAMWLNVANPPNKAQRAWALCSSCSVYFRT